MSMTGSLTKSVSRLRQFSLPRRGWLLVGILSLLSLAWLLELPSFLTLEALQQSHVELAQASAEQPVLAALIYFVAYVLITALSIPGAAALTLVGGALFGLGWGLVLVSFASSLGATLAMLLARYLLQNLVQQRFGSRLSSLNEGLQREGAFYLFTLRLVPVIPFFLINLGLGLTRLPAWTFYWVSQLGMLPGTLVYVNAGAELGQIQSVGDVLSAQLLMAFALLGIFPLVTKKGLDWFRKHRVSSQLNLSSQPKPQEPETKQQRSPRLRAPHPCDYNLIAIGAGAAGLVTTYVGAAVQARVALIEKHKMGGDCLNTGCVPSKALLSSAKVAQLLREAERFGIKDVDFAVDFAQVMEQVRAAVRRIEPHDSVERYRSLGVECFEGEAFVHSPHEVEVNGRRLRTANLVIASGARPLVPHIPGLAAVPFSHSENIWELDQLPSRMAVLGGGPIGCELAQAFCRLGSEVTLLERGDCLLPREDRDMAELVCQRLQQEGVQVCTGIEIERIGRSAAKSYIYLKDPEQAPIACDHILLAVGRRPNTEGFGLEALSLAKNADGTLQVDEYLQTSAPHVYACGDVAGPYQFTHMAGHQGWHAATNALFGPLKRFAIDYRVVPWCTYTDPELARVGLNEQQAKAQQIPYEVTAYDFAGLDRAITDRNDFGRIKVLTKARSDQILGATICGPHAGELLTEYTLALKYGLGLNKILGTIHPYPTLAESSKLLAGQWRREHTPTWIFPWLQRFHRWRRR